ncbi:MFS transporter [Paracoccus sp. 1_MG-2023]|uniref:MFS transporter n=1 Tax=unclassified Paracoccus (in: a-proteobacteria) TaxID=2688777 RepID=UPI001C091CA6|nr:MULTISPECIES: MFS transporter [unclassified Paracoccus (in: a-proteobacteria)]MBU2957641.1 MFS transporter [Paracoccus sp. C2R09]MDO6667512.1 MFS transporter [Paracoccus sp. 1_MG-2023]
MTHTVSSQPGISGRPEWMKPLAMMTLVQVAATLSVLALTSLAPEVASSLGIGAHYIGYQISLIYFAGVFASAMAGTVVETLGAERVIVLELAGFSIGLMLLATGRPLLMIAASALFGICYGLNNPASSDILHRTAHGGRHSLVFSIKQTGVPLGAVVASVTLPGLAVLMHGGGEGWRHALLAASVVPLVLMTWAWSQFTFTPIRRGAGQGNPLLRALRDQVELYRNDRLRTLALLGGLYSALQLMATAFTVVMLVDHGWSLVAAGIVAAGLQLAGATGRVSWGLAADRLGGFRTLGVIGLLAGCFMFALGWAGTMPGWMQAVLLVALGGVATGWNGVFLAAAARTAPKGKVGANTGALLVYTFIGVIVGPSTFALVYDLTGSYDLCFAIFSVIGLVGAVLSFRQAARK